jgi:iron complex transport system ATP-binding protein
MTGQEDKIIELNKAAIGYKGNANSVNVVKSDISVYALKGELVAVIGGNGVGKSTLLKTIAGFQPPVAGEVLIRGAKVSTYHEKDLALILSFVSTEIIRVPNLSVFDLVSLGRYPHTNWFGKLDDEDRSITEQAIKSVGLHGFENRMVNCISDGERQKAMIARTLAQDTDVIILDEPTAFLDLSNRYEIVHILHQLAKEKGKTILFSTHDLTTAIAESDRLWLMLSESVIQGAPEDLILNGSFSGLFHGGDLVFDQEKGDFRVRKNMKRKAVLSGEGIALGWTIKALGRNGFEVVYSEDVSGIDASVAIEVSYPLWIVRYQQSVNKFSSLLSLCRYLNGL